MIIVACIVLAAIAVAGIAGWGYYQTSIKPKHQAVLKVGDRTFSMGYIEKRVRYTVRNAGPGQPVLYNEQLAVAETLNGVEGEEINRLGAPELKISVSDEEVDLKIQQNLGLPDSADPATYADAYRREVKFSGLSPNEYRDLIASQLLEDKIRSNIRSGIPDAAEQVRLRDIRVAKEEEAQTVLDRLAAGEDFATIAGELSLDTNTKNKGGEMDWLPRAAMEPAAGDAVWPLEVGQRTQAVWSDQTNTFYIYEVLEKDPNREVTSEQRTLVENQSYNTWQKEIEDKVQVVRYYLHDVSSLAPGEVPEMIAHLMEVARGEGSGVQPGQ